MISRKVLPPLTGRKKGTEEPMKPDLERKEASKANNEELFVQ